ncbi:type I-D CRISPR-associated protein Cas7/Csc2 (plasmid) [Paracoccus liaowanqingii]|uniref:Type I-D CRISPR-associated protein Cas7/Csc2 n=1 Tax=Paracoccus liaowanqingii TaxID=2560053 RepID=A0A4Y5SSL2_9RHOB|nr:type I-D CRISPR-associated protein Cas7/Csc2 [Paracoccus liaowanqingii]QDA35786.1 type I-D CRISPR-associated protein Cas7/Csc2 [Paracoccus liaowanqingii]
MPITDIKPFLGTLDELLFEAQGKDKTYAQPALKNLGSVTLFVLREVISPASFRNADAEITDIEVGGERHVRAVANKFKFGERARGLQILRFLNAGGTLAQNKTVLRKGEKPGDRFDLNTFVFGDSATQDNKFLPVKAAAQYSDAVSLQDYGSSVDRTFHNRASEDGTLFNAETKQPSVNIFERHFVKPSTLLLQTISLNGRTAPAEALEHLLLAISLAGAYGGQTSIYGVNVKNHVVALCGGRFERELASPYAMITALHAAGADISTADAAATAIRGLVEDAWPVVIPGSEIADRQKAMIATLEGDDAEMRTRYLASAGKISSYFNAWFEGIS